jgi:hypothetical protein
VITHLDLIDGVGTFSNIQSLCLADVMRGARLSESVRHEARAPTAEYQDVVAHVSGSASAMDGRVFRIPGDTGVSSTYRASDSLQYDISIGTLTFLGPTSIPQGSTDVPSLVGGQSISWST